jgi:phenylalanyl-tRNA synthetase beta chain
MKVPLGWLKEFVDVRAEPKKLAEDLTLAGLAVEGIEAHGAETVFELDITTNRVDCMNVFGVAREVSVLYGVPLRGPEVSLRESGRPAGECLEVAIASPALCPRFCARVLDVRIGPSPAWIRERLELLGVRPINNVVDLTNYVLMELGHPSHAFDLARVAGGQLLVRFAREGEKLTTLDGVARTLAPAIGVVAGTEGPLGLAGIMGGASSEVSEATTTIALEAAYWNPLTVRRAAKALSMHTEASHRFERGADPEAPPRALDRIAHLLAKIGAGSVRPGLVDVGKAPPRRWVALRHERIRAVLGVAVPEERTGAILAGLGFSPGAPGTFTVPSFRGDVTREEDLIEEVARHYGLDKIPSELPPAREPGTLSPLLTGERAVRGFLVGAGLTEVTTLAFVSESEAGASGEPLLALANPIAEDQGALRNSVVVPGLLGALRTNVRQGRRDVAIFEIGQVFRQKDRWPGEERRLGILLAGSARAGHWADDAPRAFDVFDVKGLLEGLSVRLDVRPFGFGKGPHLPFLHPGRSAALLRDGRSFGHFGALHPDLHEAWEVRGDVVVAELDMGELFRDAPGPVRFEALGRFPVVHRDLSVVVDAALSASEVERTALLGAGELARSARIVDRYVGPPIPEGRVNLTVALRLQNPERTLTSEEVQASLGRAVEALKELGAEIRGE